MQGASLVVSADALSGIFLFLLYAAAGAVAVRLLIPRLGRSAKLLAAGMLIAQVALILMSLQAQPPFSYPWWLWHLDREYNIPTTLASMQLATLAGAAMLAGWQGRARGKWQRLYLLALAPLFLYLALDEFFLFHEDDEMGFAALYLSLGTIVVALTLIVAARSGRREWRWHIAFLAGLALAAFGAFGIDKALFQCGDIGIFSLDKCLYLVPLEEACEFLGVWLALLGMLGLGQADAPGPSRRARRMLLSLPFIWLLLLLLYSLTPRLELRLMASPAQVEFDSGLRLHGYQIHERAGETGILLYSSGRQANYPWLGYTTVYIDQATGETAARRDRFSRGQLLWYMGADYRHVYREPIALLLPDDLPVNRAYWIAMTHWRERAGDYATQAVISSDLPLLTDTHVVLGETLRRAPPSPVTDAALATFSNGFALQSFQLPDRIQAGDALPISFTWRSDIDSDDDHIQFLHLRHDDTGEYVVHDQPPLGARLPTRLWYAGLMDSETWLLPLPADLQPGAYAVFTGLYRKSDQQRLPAVDAGGTAWLDARVALGALVID